MANENELHDNEQEIVDEAQQMPVGTEEQSYDSVKKAEKGGKIAKKRHADKTGGDKAMPKVQAGDPDRHTEDYDFSDDLDALIAEEATLSDSFKAKSAVIFEAAISSKVAEEVSRLEEEYETRLSEEVEEIRDGLVEKVDSYLNYVVENWMEENQLAIQNGLRSEIAENFMNNLKDLFLESYIEVPEAKIDLVDELAEQVEELEGKLNETTAAAIEMSEALEAYQRDQIVMEAASDLADTQVEKLKSLVESLDFEDEESFASKVKTVKESYFKKETVAAEDISEEVSEDGEDTIVESNSSMDRYLAAIRKSNEK